MQDVQYVEWLKRCHRTVKVDLKDNLSEHMNAPLHNPIDLL